jgi:hypothetical protein
MGIHLIHAACRSEDVLIIEALLVRESCVWCGGDGGPREHCREAKHADSVTDTFHAPIPPWICKS